MRWMMYRWWCEGGGDRAWWVIESVFLRSPDKGFWACHIPPDMPIRPETWVSLCNLMLKLCGISRSPAILGSDSPQSNNRTDHSLWVTPFIPRERPNVKHAIAGYSRLPRPTSTPALMRVLHWLRCWAEEPGYATRLVLPYNAVHSIQQTEQIPNDPSQMGAKSTTTTSNHPSTPLF